MVFNFCKCINTFHLIIHRRTIEKTVTKESHTKTCFCPNDSNTDLFIGTTFARFQYCSSNMENLKKYGFFPHFVIENYDYFSILKCLNKY